MSTIRRFTLTQPVYYSVIVEAKDEAHAHAITQLVGPSDFDPKLTMIGTWEVEEIYGVVDGSIYKPKRETRGS